MFCGNFNLTSHNGQLFTNLLHLFSLSACTIFFTGTETWTFDFNRGLKSKRLITIDLQQWFQT